MESIGSGGIEEEREKAAEIELEKILDDPENAFLSEHQMHKDRIENAATSVEALQIVENLLLLRLQQTFRYDPIRPEEGVELMDVNVTAIKEKIEGIKSAHDHIGEGVMHMSLLLITTLSTFLQKSVTK